MNKFSKYVVVGGMLAALAFAAGCGDDKKPAAKPEAKPATKTTAPAQKTATAPLPAGPHWRYPSYIKNQEDTPKVTPEIQKIVDECAAQSKLAPSENGLFLNDSKISKSDQRPVRNLHFHANGANNNMKVKFQNSKGKTVTQQEIYHIYFTVDKDTSAIKNWEFYKYEVNQANPDGKKTVIKKG